MSLSDSPKALHGLASCVEDDNAQWPLPPKGPSCAPRSPGSVGSLEDRYLDLILRVVDDQRVGQGVLGERGEVGLGQQGLQCQKHLLLIGQTLGVC